MGDAPVELNLDFGVVVGDDGDGAAEAEAGGRALDDYDPYYDAGDGYVDGGDFDDDCDPDDGPAGGFEQEEDADGECDYGEGGIVAVKREETDDEGDRERETAPEVASDDEGGPNADDPHRKRPARIYQPSSLLRLATAYVARNVEKYPPAALGVLSEHQWEGVVEARIGMQLRKQEMAGKKMPEGPKGRRHIGYDGDCGKKSGRKKQPALGANVLSPIERHPNNAHLSHSRVVDELLWRTIVDHDFGGMSRPRSMEVPCEAVKERLREWGGRLAELMAPPVGREEFETSEEAAKFGLSQPEETPEETCDAKQGGKRKRDELVEELFGEDSEDEQPAEQPVETKADNSQERIFRVDVAHRQYLEFESNKRTNALRFVLESLQHSPMDVALLSETDIGKSASKAVKSMKKLDKLADDDGEEEALGGYPRFWKEVAWGEEKQRSRNHQFDGDLRASPFRFLQQILQDWKDMASGGGADAPPPSKKQKTGDGIGAVATCGRDKRTSSEQHAVDMRLLHASPDWRSLHRSLRKREGLLQKARGDKIRGIRESLEKGRAKVGKVTLKRAVGRVRGNSAGGGADSRRREAILNKSRGARNLAIQKAAASSSRDKSRMSMLRQEAATASSWRKSGVARKPPSSFAMSVANASFGASVARAGSRGGGKKPQTHVQLKGGKQMKLPPSSIGGLGKTVGVRGVFSTLQKRKAAQERQVKKAGGSPGAGGRMQQLRRQAEHGRRRTGPPQQRQGGRGDVGRVPQRQRKGSRDDRMGGGFR